MQKYRFKAECENCGEVLKACDGEGLTSKKRRHALDCHEGFEIGKMGNPEPVGIRDYM